MAEELEMRSPKTLVKEESSNMASGNCVKAQTVMNSADKAILDRIVRFWASSVDVFLQDFLKASKELRTEDDIELRSLVATRIVTLVSEMAFFFGAVSYGDLSTASVQAHTAAIRAIHAMVDREIDKLYNQAKDGMS